MAIANSGSGKSSATAKELKAPSAATAAWWLVAAALLLGLFFIVRPPADPEAELLAARKQQIEAMSAAERERLEANLERFEELPAERQEALREIEAAVRDDEDLSKALADFERWVSTLSPWERMELRNANSPDDKLQFVSAITTARKQEAEDSIQNQLQFEEYVKQNLARFQGQERRPEPVRLSDNQLSNMMTALDDYGSQVKVSKTSLPGCAAYNIQLLTEAIKAQIQKAGFETARETPLSDETVQKMIDQITDPKSLDHVQDIFEKAGSKGFTLYVAFKLEMAWWHESHEHPLTQDELDEVAKNFGGNFLEEYEKRKKTDPRGAYFQLLMATRRATFQMDTRDVSDLLEQLGLRPYRVRPTGNSPAFGGGDNRGPRNDNDDHDGRGPRNDNDDHDGRGPRGDDNDRDDRGPRGDDNDRDDRRSENDDGKRRGRD